MKLVIQRVKKASVEVIERSEIVGQINLGLFILIGVGDGDTLKDADVIAKKVLKLRIMSDDTGKRSLAGTAGKMNLSIKDMGGEILVVSQFTLYADTTGGNRPSFISAAKSEIAKQIYEHFISKLKEAGMKVETGEFGSYMNISAQLDGPVTILY